MNPFKRIVRGDIDGFFGLFIDNLLQLMLITTLCQIFCGFSMEFLLTRILPGAALSILVGNLFYGWQAKRLMERTGRDDVTALPYGINTLSLIAFIFFIMAPIYRETQDADLAWKAGLFACFMSGVIEFLGSFIAAPLRKHTPRAALLSALAGIAITFISVGFVFQIFANPAIALIPMMLIIIFYAGNIRLPFGIPSGMLAVGVGVAIAWGLRAAGYELYQPPVQNITPGIYLPIPAMGEVIEFFTSGAGWKYLAVIIPMGLFSVIGSLQCLESSEAAGDSYDTRSSLMVNGGGTMIAALFGSAFPTTIYIGHPGWKAMGARSAYSTMNGIVIALLCLVGGVSYILQFVPLEVTLGILLWIGMIITAQAFQAAPSQHAPAVAFGLVPALAGWAYVLINNAVLATGSNLVDTQEAFARMDFYIGGVIALNQGSLLTSTIFAALLVNVIEQKFRIAAIWAFAAAALSAFGLIHAYELSPAGAAPKLGFWTCPEFTITYAITGLTLLALPTFAVKSESEKVSPADDIED